MFSPWEVQQTWYRQQTVIWCTAFCTECDNFPRLYHDLIVPIIYNVSSSAVINFKVLSTNLAKCVIFASVRRPYERKLFTVLNRKYLRMIFRRHASKYSWLILHQKAAKTCWLACVLFTRRCFINVGAKVGCT